MGGKWFFQFFSGFSGFSGSGSGISDPDRARAGKPVFPFCPILAQPGHLQTSAGYLRIGLNLRITLVPLKIRNSGSRKPIFPFCPIVAQSGHLKTSTGYLQIGHELRILTVPKNPDFRFRIGRKIRKTEKTGKSENCM